MIKPQECGDDGDKLGPCPRGPAGLQVPLHEPGGRQGDTALELGQEGGRFLDFSPHAIAPLQGPTLHLSF